MGTRCHKGYVSDMTRDSLVMCCREYTLYSIILYIQWVPLNIILLKGLHTSMPEPVLTTCQNTTSDSSDSSSEYVCNRGTVQQLMDKQPVQPQQVQFPGTL